MLLEDYTTTTDIDTAPMMPKVSVLPNEPATVVQDGEIQDLIRDDNVERAPVAPDVFDPAYRTSRLEIWSWYLYYISNSGLTLFNLAPTAFQNLVSQAAGDAGVLHFAGQ